MEGRGETGFAVLVGSLVILGISASDRAIDNMVTTTLPMLGNYVFNLGTLYGGVAVAVYTGSELFANLFVNPRLAGPLRRRVFRGCSAGIALICALLSVAGPAAAMALTALAGVTTSIIAQNVVVSASTTSDRRRGERNLALYTLGLSVSLVAGPSLESYLLRLSYSAVFFGFAVLGALVFLLSLKVSLPEVRSANRTLGPGARQGLRSAFFLGATFSIPLAAFVTLLPIYSAEIFNVSAAAAYSAFIPMYAVSLGVRLLLTARPLDSLVLPTAVSVVITLVGLSAFYFAPSFEALLLVMGVLGVPHGMAFAGALITAARTSEPGERNVTNSYLSAYMGAIGIVVPVSMGYLSASVGIRLAFPLLLVPTGLVSAAYFLPIFRAKGRRNDPYVR